MLPSFMAEHAAERGAGAPTPPSGPAAAPSSLQPPDGVWEQRITVELDYPVVFTRAVFDAGNHALAWALGRREPERRQRMVVVLDAGVERAWPQLRSAIDRYAEAHGARLELVCAPWVIEGGEASKNDPTLVGDLQARFRAAGLDRHAHVVIVGGGAVQDVVGYAAATTHRGLRVVRVPTTVLAQNDAGIGVKNGVNAFGTKNFLGTFAAPFAVINDVDFVWTLEERDRRAGVAEAVKVGLIRDPAFFDWLETHADALRTGEHSATETMIRRCAELHLRHIATSGDPFETGSARPLDFGHWAAHKLESLSEHALRHGEAVAIGIAVDARYSALQGRLGEDALERVVALLQRLGLAIGHPALDIVDGEGRRAVLRGLQEFREHLGGDLTITLLDDIGRGVEVDAIDVACMERAIAWVQARHAGATG